MKKIKGFASDNCSGVHSKILEAIQKSNIGHTLGYGNDPYTLKAIEIFKKHFGENSDIYFVYNGTGANVLVLKALSDSFNSIICTESSHINLDECCAPEKFTGCKLIAIATDDGKLNVESIKPHIFGFGNPHHAQPKIISITQPTEIGTLYSPQEIKELANYAHANNMFLHLDGARISNAAASLNKSFKEFTFDLGVDAISFGGTKNGLLCGEAVIFADKKISRNFLFIRKQGMQLASKMRFIAAQFEEFLSANLWLDNAKHANKMAKLLADEVQKNTNIKITQKVQANAVFAIVPKRYISKLQESYPFYIWNEKISEVRWMCSFDTTEDDIHGFVKLLKQTIS